MMEQKQIMRTPESMTPLKAKILTTLHEQGPLSELTLSCKFGEDELSGGMAAVVLITCLELENEGYVDPSPIDSSKWKLTAKGLAHCNSNCGAAQLADEALDFGILRALECVCAIAEERVGRKSQLMSAGAEARMRSMSEPQIAEQIGQMAGDAQRVSERCRNLQQSALIFSVDQVSWKISVTGRMALRKMEVALATTAKAN